MYINNLFIDFPKTDLGLNQQTAEDVIATKSNASLSPTSAAQMENFKAYATKDTATCKKYDVTKIKTGIFKRYFISNVY